MDKKTLKDLIIEEIIFGSDALDKETVDKVISEEEIDRRELKNDIRQAIEYRLSI